jgi:hypothetical protein
LGAVASAALKLVGKNAEAEKEAASTETAFAGLTMHHA